MKNKNQAESNPAQARIAGFRSNMRKVLIGVCIFSIYGTGFLNILFNPSYEHRFSAGNILNAFFSSKTTLLLFPLLLTGLSMLAISSVHKTWEESLRDDKLNRGFLHSKKVTPYGDAHFEDPYEYLDAAQIRPVEKCKGKILCYRPLGWRKDIYVCQVIYASGSKRKAFTVYRRSERGSLQGNVWFLQG